MSALGTKPTWVSAPHMSAFGGRADMAFALRHVLSSDASFVARASGPNETQSSPQRSKMTVYLSVSWLFMPTYLIEESHLLAECGCSRAHQQYQCVVVESGRRARSPCQRYRPMIAAGGHSRCLRGDAQMIGVMVAVDAAAFLAHAQKPGGLPSVDADLHQPRRRRVT